MHTWLEVHDHSTTAQRKVIEACAARWSRDCGVRYTEIELHKAGNALSPIDTSAQACGQTQHSRVVQALRQVVKTLTRGEHETIAQAIGDALHQTIHFLM